MTAAGFLIKKLTEAGYRIEALNVSPEVIENIIIEYARSAAEEGFNAGINNVVWPASYPDIDEFLDKKFPNPHHP